MREIGVVTVARSDYGIYRSLLQSLQAADDVQLSLYVSGMHLSPDHGWTSKIVENDGYRIADRIDMLMSADSPTGIAKSIGNSISGFAQSFDRWRPDILVVLGDRFDMIGAAIAALPFKIPVAHIHGGEVTSGAIDDMYRHCLTKLSHLHFVSTEDYGRRVIQLGEQPWRVTVSGAPGLDLLKQVQLFSKEEIEKRYGLNLSEAPLLVTFHPVTLQFEDAARQTMQLLDAIDVAGMPVVFTQPNADTNGSVILQMIRAYLLTHNDAAMVENFGAQGYFSMMKYASAMVGNSSSGLVEAPSVHLPVVNVGDRQGGRIRGVNVIDTNYETQDILRAIKTAVSKEFRQSLIGTVNPYGDGTASQRIADRLRTVEIDGSLISKGFYDLPETVSSSC